MSSAVFCGEAGPGHGGPGLVANAYLEGTYSEVYPNISCDEEGMKRLFTQFSFPVEFRATLHQRRPVQFTKAENSVTLSRTPTERLLITRISSLLASSGTARRRPDRWQRAGIPISS